MSQNNSDSTNFSLLSLFGAGLFCIPLLFAPLLSPHRGSLFAYALYSIVLLGWFCLGIHRLLYPQTSPLTCNKTDLLLCAFLGLLGLSFIVHTPRLESWRLGFPCFAIFCGYFALKTLTPDSSPWRSFYFRLASVAVLWTAIDALVQYYIVLDRTRLLFASDPQRYLVEHFGPHYTEAHRQLFQSRLDTQRAFGQFLLPNGLAGYLGLWFFVFASLTLQAKSLRTRLLWFIALFLCTWALFLTKSRGAFLALGIVGGFYLAYRSPWTHKSLKIAYGTSLTLGTTFLYGISSGFIKLPPFGDFLQNGIASFMVRLTYWKVSLQMLLTFPLGVGFHNFAVHYFQLKPASAGDTKYAHNNFLQLANELSLLGLALFLLFFWRAAFSPPQSPPLPSVLPPKNKTRHSLLLSLGLTSIVLLYSAYYVFLEGLSFGDPSLSSREICFDFCFQIFVLIGLLAFFTYTDTPEEPLKLQGGLQLGLAFFAVHSFVDFDFYLLPLLWNVCFFLALIQAPFTLPNTSLFWNGWIRGFFLFFLLFVYFFLGFYPELRRESLVEEAQFSMQKASQAKSPQEASALFSRSLELLDRAYQLYPQDWKILILKAHYLASVQGEGISQALLVAQQACDSAPYATDTWQTLLRLHTLSLSQRRLKPDSVFLQEKILPALEGLICAYPERAKSHYEQGKVYRELGEKKKAKVAFEKALQFSQESWDQEQRLNPAEKEEIERFLSSLKE
jgi:hypothetical protein